MIDADLEINADYARLIQPFICREETRYYLGGFFVAPAQEGAFIVATDGHTMAIFRDAKGRVAKPGIVHLSRPTLAACKPGSGRKTVPAEGRTLVVRGQRAEVYREHVNGRGNLVAAQDEAVIDGTFPDWRRVVPAMPTTFGAASVNAAYLSRFASIMPRRDRPSLTAYAKSAADPVLVLTDRDDFVGIVMPMRTNHQFPNWL